jgi:hypothetical protein
MALKRAEVPHVKAEEGVEQGGTFTFYNETRSSLWNIVHRSHALSNLVFQSRQEDPINLILL